MTLYKAFIRAFIYTESVRAADGSTTGIRKPCRGYSVELAVAGKKGKLRIVNTFCENGATMFGLTPPMPEIPEFTKKYEITGEWAPVSIITSVAQ